MMLAVFLIGTQFVYVDQALKSKHWRPTEAQVVTLNEAMSLGAKYDNIDDVIRNCFLPGFFALPRLPFKFTIHGTTYAAVNYSYSTDPFGLNQQDVNFEHPPGSIVTVYYDPFHPENAVVKPGTNEHFYLVLVSGMLVFILGYYIINRPRELI